MVRKMEGGNIAPPGPRRKRQLEQLAREPLAGLWCFLFPCTILSPHAFRRPKPLSFALPAPAASAVWRGLGLLDPGGQLRGWEQARGTGMGEAALLTAAGFRGLCECLKADYYFFFLANCCSRRGGRGEGRGG